MISPMLDEMKQPECGLRAANDQKRAYVIAATKDHLSLACARLYRDVLLLFYPDQGIRRASCV